MISHSEGDCPASAWRQHLVHANCLQQPPLTTGCLRHSRIFHIVCTALQAPSLKVQYNCTTTHLFMSNTRVRLNPPAAGRGPCFFSSSRAFACESKKSSCKPEWKVRAWPGQCTRCFVTTGQASLLANIGKPRKHLSSLQCRRGRAPQQRQEPRSIRSCYHSVDLLLLTV